MSARKVISGTDPAATNNQIEWLIRDRDLQGTALDARRQVKGAELGIIGHVDPGICRSPVVEHLSVYLPVIGGGEHQGLGLVARVDVPGKLGADHAVEVLGHDLLVAALDFDIDFVG